MERHTYLTLTAPEEARERWFSRIGELCAEPEEEFAPLSEALHRVISRPVEARVPRPPFTGPPWTAIAVKAERTFSASAA